MRVIQGNIWNYRGDDSAICITTNGITNNKNELVMGKGIALDCKLKCPGIALELGCRVLLYGNQPFYLPEYNIISFPSKHDWKTKSHIDLIERSAQKIKEIAALYFIPHVYSVWPGINNGGLSLDVVRPILERVWDSDKFVIVELTKLTY